MEPDAPVARGELLQPRHRGGVAVVGSARSVDLEHEVLACRGMQGLRELEDALARLHRAQVAEPQRGARSAGKPQRLDLRSEGRPVDAEGDDLDRGVETGALVRRGERALSALRLRFCAAGAAGASGAAGAAGAVVRRRSLRRSRSAR